MNKKALTETDIRSKFSSQEKASTNLFTVGASYRF